MPYYKLLDDGGPLYHVPQYPYGQRIKYFLAFLLGIAAGHIWHTAQAVAQQTFNWIG